MLCNSSARIVSLDSDNYPVLKRLLAHPMTSLETLSLRLDGFEIPDDASDLAGEPAKVVPALRKLSVGGNIGGFGFCIPHLTHFKFHGWYSQEIGGKMLLSILDVFRRCPMLEVVDVAWGEEFYDFQPPDLTQVVPVPLSHLRHLAQEQYVQITQPWLPDLLRLPKLCSVFLKAPILYLSMDTDPLSHPFLSANRPSLTDIRHVKLRAPYDPSYDAFGAAIETTIETINGQGAILSLQAAVLLVSSEPRPDWWTAPRDALTSLGLCVLQVFSTGSPLVLCLDNYQLGDEASTSVVQALYDLEKVTTLILCDSTVEPCLVALEPDNREKLVWCSTVHSLVIYSPSQLDSTGSDVLQSLLRVSKKRKMAGAPFRSVTLVIPSGTLVVSSGELAALDEYIERFEFLTGDDAMDWDVDRYFIPDYDPVRTRPDEFAFDVI